ncbi:hypothetical protein Tco_0985279 [Tanacetum coccineum]
MLIIKRPKIAAETRLIESLGIGMTKPNRGLLTIVILNTDEWIMYLLQIDRLRNEDLKQKCRSRWVVGDENSRFLHSILNNRYAKYAIKGMHINGCPIDFLGDIKQAALDHYAARFKESNMHQPLLESNIFRKLSSSEASLLESDFSFK